MVIDKKTIVFLDTNILSDIGRFNENKIRDISFSLMAKMKLLVALTPFNIMEIENIPDEAVKKRIHYFLNITNVVFLKDMNALFDDEVESYQTGAIVNPIMFMTNLVSKQPDGKPSDYKSLLGNLLSKSYYQAALTEHNAIINEYHERYTNKLIVPDEVFVETLFKERLSKSKLYPNLANENWEDISRCCPSYIAYAYSLYDKIGSKGLRRKSGEMNDTAMSYIFPYVGIIVTEKRQATVFNKIKTDRKIPALENSIILKHSDVFKEQDFQLEEILADMN